MMSAYDYMELLQKDYAINIANVLYAVAIEPTNYKNRVFKQYDEIVLYFYSVNDHDNHQMGFSVEGNYKNKNKDYGTIYAKVENKLQGRIKRKNWEKQWVSEVCDAMGKDLTHKIIKIFTGSNNIIFTLLLHT